MGFQAEQLEKTSSLFVRDCRRRPSAAPRWLFTGEPPPIELCQWRSARWTRHPSARRTSLTLAVGSSGPDSNLAQRLGIQLGKGEESSFQREPGLEDIRGIGLGELPLGKETDFID